MGQPWWDPTTRTLTPDRPSPGMHALGWVQAVIARENRKRDRHWRPPPRWGETEQTVENNLSLIHI
eukprot:4256485-Prorocentrum_lima.AAC.1